MYDVIIIGGGQAGLALGYFLQQQRRHFIILDAAPSVGHSWRTRWDSLTLFTPCPYNSLPGFAFPKPPGLFPTKDDVADYLQQYAARFDLPISLNQPVVSLEPATSGFVVQTPTTAYHTQQVVIATGPFQTPFIPQWSANLPPHVMQLHSKHYRNPQQLPSGPVLVVGAGNSGVQIAEELARTHQVALSVGRQLRAVPRSIYQHTFFWRLYLYAASRVTTESPLGSVLRQQDTLFGNSPEHLRRHFGITLVGRAEGVTGEQILFQGGQAVRASSVVWATGFRPDYSWVKLPICDGRGQPHHHRGVTRVPGVYFLGLFWQTWAGSSMLGGVGRDARLIASCIEYFDN